ncbi:MAG: hypothetical protein ACLSDQ_12075 [Adlercreutzia equolifaciens]
MADKAILFDSSRCSACQACVAACKGRFGLGPASSSEDMAARAFGRAAVLDEELPLPWRASSARWPMDTWFGKRPALLRALRPGALRGGVPRGCGVQRETGFVALDAARCVSRYVGSMVSGRGPASSGRAR